MDKLTDEMRSFLQEKRFAVVATINKDGTPQQTVVWYDLRGERILMNTRVGRLKERNLQRDPRITFCVEDEYRYVVLKGRVDLEYDPERAQADMKALAIRYHGRERGEQLSRDSFALQERVSLYMTVDAAEMYND